MDGLLMSSLYLLNSWRNCKVLPFLFWHCFFSLPAIRFSAGSNALSNCPTAARHDGSKQKLEKNSGLPNLEGIKTKKKIPPVLHMFTTPLTPMKNLPKTPGPPWFSPIVLLIGLKTIFICNIYHFASPHRKWKIDQLSNAIFQLIFCLWFLI